MKYKFYMLAYVIITSIFISFYYKKENYEKGIIDFESIFSQNIFIYMIIIGNCFLLIYIFLNIIKTRNEEKTILNNNKKTNREIIYDFKIKQLLFKNKIKEEKIKNKEEFYSFKTKETYFKNKIKKEIREKINESLNINKFKEQEDYLYKYINKFKDPDYLIKKFVERKKELYFIIEKNIQSKEIKNRMTNIITELENKLLDNMDTLKNLEFKKDLILQIEKENKEIILKLEELLNDISIEKDSKVIDKLDEIKKYMNLISIAKKNN